MREFALIERLAVRLKARREDTRIAIGDDAAVIAPPPGCELAITTDTLIAGRHFPHDTPAADIGYKALAVNLSDLAAMGADPAWVTLALTVPALDSAWCDDVIDGALAAIGDAAVDIVGGDTTRGALAVTITAVGTLPAGQAIERDGACVGDVVAVSGTLGDAALGLSLWPPRGDEDDDTRYLIARLCRPQWRNGAALRGHVHAAIDVSDGLAADLGHVLAASGVGARIEVDALPRSVAFQRANLAPPERRRLQLTGGDDYELCVALPGEALAPAAALLDCPLTPIGTIETQPGMRLVDARGEPVVAPAVGEGGWDHFA